MSGATEVNSFAFNLNNATSEMWRHSQNIKIKRMSPLAFESLKPWSLYKK